MSLKGLKVVELGTVIAGPFAGSLLVDLGAEVVKVEPPGPGDALRQMGPLKDGVPIWWGVSARGKKCVSLDLKSPRGKELFLSLVSTADVLIENYRPGVLTRLGLDWPVLHALNPDLVMLSISGFGQTGPQAMQPGFGKIAECMSGLVSLTGSPEDRPLFVGFSLADASTGLFGVFAVMVALFERDHAGAGGAHIDLALYEPLLRMMDIQFAVEAETGEVPARRGTNDPYQWGAATERPVKFGAVASSSGEWFFVAVPAGEPEAALRRLMGGDKRAENASGNFFSRVAEWAAGFDTAELLSALRACGADVSRVYDGASIASDRYFKAREDVLSVTHPVLGDFMVPGFVLDSGESRDRVRFRAAPVGADNSEILSRWLGLTETQIEALRQDRVI